LPDGLLNWRLIKKIRHSDEVVFSVQRVKTVDYEIIFDICENHIFELKSVITLLIKDEFASDKKFPTL